MMTRRIQVVGVVCAGLMLAASTATATGSAAAAAQVGRAGVPRGCAAPKVGQVGCAALLTPRARALRASAVAASSTPPPGYSPLQLRSAYGLDFSAITGGAGQTVAVVTAYDDATAESDMGIYRAEYDLPACTTANGCFKKVDATGGTSYPPSMTGWSAPTAESLDMISAICPNCHILLVEADTPAIPTTTDPDALGQAENEAVALGAKFIDNTVFTSESTYATQEPTLDSEYFDHPGVAITAPDGAGGYGPWYPAASPDVIAVGGTTLSAAPGTARGWTEAAWSGTGSGCSAYEAKPAWQTDTGCTDRTLNDLSADADNVNSPVAFYDTPSGDWVTGGGNDVSAAIIAAAYALAGTPTASTNPASYPYAHTTLINDITTGSTGTCTPTYYCTAGTGYDGPTGLGTPASAAALGPDAPTAPGTPSPIYDTASSHLEVYLGAGDLFEKSWAPASGWTNYINLGGSITGTSSAIYNPVTKHLEIYARGASGTLEQEYWVAGSGWSDWVNLGGSIASSPAAVYDTASGDLEVYATGTNGALEQNRVELFLGLVRLDQSGRLDHRHPVRALRPRHQTPRDIRCGAATARCSRSTGPLTSGWSGWVNLGGSLASADSPAAVYDPASGNLEVYVTWTDGTLEEKYWAARVGLVRLGEPRWVHHRHAVPHLQPSQQAPRGVRARRQRPAVREVLVPGSGLVELAEPRRLPRQRRQPGGRLRPAQRQLGGLRDLGRRLAGTDRLELFLGLVQLAEPQRVLSGVPR